MSIDHKEIQCIQLHVYEMNIVIKFTEKCFSSNGAVLILIQCVCVEIKTHIG